jgi:hypothetical protein
LRHFMLQICSTWFMARVRKTFCELRVYELLHLLFIMYGWL